MSPQGRDRGTRIPVASVNLPWQQPHSIGSRDAIGSGDAIGSRDAGSRDAVGSRDACTYVFEVPKSAEMTPEGNQM